ncbi:hypothetical protein [Horticoccus sp. 23ND18S-11]|uniref:hypothetical protein n=1 Tax=Horticoccus sp. 23ND18S-11 TaxID=3391832 RepID=UPI0039C96FD7
MRPRLVPALRSLGFISAALLLPWVAPAAPASSPPDLRAGFAERDISPAIGQERPGGYGKAFHRTFRDPCKVRVAVFARGGTTVALVGVDALMLSRAAVLAARAGIARATGIPAGAVMISASHSHTSGPVGMVQPGEYDAAPAALQTLAYEESSLADPAYLARVVAAIVDGVAGAHAALAPARLSFGVGHEDKVGFNRRLRMKQGQTWTNPGAANPEIVGYAAPIDPDVGVIGAWDLQGRLIGSIVNHACHTNVIPEGISANWVCHLERTIQGALDSKAPVVFLPGACGDISKLDALSAFERPPEDEWMRIVGGRIGAEAVKVLLSATRGADIALEARSKVWNIARRVPLPAKVERARGLIAAGKPKSNPALTEWTFAKETLMAEFLARTSPEVEVEVQAIQIGPVVCLSNPAEYFVEYGLELKRRSPFPFTFPVELANGCVGYVPTEEAFSPQGGGYETRLTSYSNLAVSAGRQFADAGVELATALKPGPVPMPARLARPGVPWLYGNVPPQSN